jgi:peptidoglycan glycosyltransferase
VNQSITRLAVAAVVLIASLIVATTYWQAWAAASLADRQDNAIQRVAEFEIKRGEILTEEGAPLAVNVRKRVGGRTLYFRKYPQHRLFSHVVGYSTQARSRAGIERSWNDYLTASNANLNTVVDRTLDELRGSTIEGNDLILTLNPRAQRAALQALGSRCGAVVAIEPPTGRVLVMASSPSYDPNLIEGKFKQASRAPNADCRPAAPLLNRATDGLYAPGSTFKVMTAAAALDSGKYTLDSRFDDPGYCEEYGKRVNNYDTTRPFGNVDLRQAMQYSINSVFCNIGKAIGPLTILNTARKFGFYEKPPLGTPTSERSASGLYQDGELFFPKNPNKVDPGRLAFGQERMLVTPLQMAMVAAGVANDGVVMQPYVVDRVVNPKGNAVTTTKPRELGRAMTEATAAALTEAMTRVVESGTGTAAQLSGVPVAGKTGTAETGIEGLNTVSFLSFAPANAPRVAIAVIVEQQRSTGGETAAPIAKEVMQALLADRRTP